MGEIRPNPNIVIDPEYELWREDKEYWWTKLEEIKKQFMYRSLDKLNLSEFAIKLHEWQSHVNNIFGVKDTTPITVRVKLSHIDNSLQVYVLMNEELRNLFDFDFNTL